MTGALDSQATQVAKNRRPCGLLKAPCKMLLTDPHGIGKLHEAQRLGKALPQDHFCLGDQIGTSGGFGILLALAAYEAGKEHGQAGAERVQANA